MVRRLTPNGAITTIKVEGHRRVRALCSSTILWRLLDQSVAARRYRRKCRPVDANHEIRQSKVLQAGRGPVRSRIVALMSSLLLRQLMWRKTRSILANFGSYQAFPPPFPRCHELGRLKSIHMMLDAGHPSFEERCQFGKRPRLLACEQQNARPRWLGQGCQY